MTQQYLIEIPPSETLLRADAVVSGWLNGVAAEGGSRLAFGLWFLRVSSGLAGPGGVSSRGGSLAVAMFVKVVTCFHPPN